MKNKKAEVIMEYSRLNREKSIILLDKSFLMYYTFVFVGITGFISGYFDLKYLNIMVFLSFGTLLIGIIPYVYSMAQEQNRLNELMPKEKHQSSPRKGSRTI